MTVTRTPDEAVEALQASCLPCELAAQTAEAPLSTSEDPGDWHPWEGALTYEGQMTGDGRYIEPNALRWDTLPIPLRWVESDTGAHQGARVVGKINEIERRDDGAIWAKGVFDLGSEVGKEAARQVKLGLTPGVSIDMDDVSFEVRVAAETQIDGDPEDIDENGRVKQLAMKSDDEVMITNSGRIRAATLIAIPAFEPTRLTASAEAIVRRFTTGTKTGGSLKKRKKDDDKKTTKGHDDSKHPHAPAGSDKGGEFIETDSKPPLRLKDIPKKGRGGGGGGKSKAEQEKEKKEREEKREDKAEDREEDREEKETGGLPDGPIEDADDLMDAIEQVDEADEPGTAKAYILRRAKALDRMDLIPQEWLNLAASAEFANWVEQTGTGHLPQYIKRISKHLKKKGMTESHAIATAVNVVKKMCATGDVNFPGAQQVNAGSRTEACAAVAEWEAKKAEAKASALRRRVYGLTAAAVTADSQLRVPKGNGPLSGRWVDMPGALADRLNSVMDSIHSNGVFKDAIDREDSQDIRNAVDDLAKTGLATPEFPKKAARASDLVTERADRLREFLADTPTLQGEGAEEWIAELDSIADDLGVHRDVDWYSDPDFDPGFPEMGPDQPSGSMEDAENRRDSASAPDDGLTTDQIIEQRQAERAAKQAERQAENEKNYPVGTTGSITYYDGQHPDGMEMPVEVVGHKGGSLNVRPTEDEGYGTLSISPSDLRQDDAGPTGQPDDDVDLTPEEVDEFDKLLEQFPDALEGSPDEGMEEAKLRRDRRERGEGPTGPALDAVLDRVLPDIDMDAEFSEEIQAKVDEYTAEVILDLGKLSATKEGVKEILALFKPPPKSPHQVVTALGGVITVFKELGEKWIGDDPELYNFVIDLIVNYSHWIDLFVGHGAGAHSSRRVIVAGSFPLQPPPEWFSDPGLNEPTPLRVDSDGRVYGHLAVWGTCHTAYPGQCVTPPYSRSSYSYFRTGSVVLSNGAEVPTGVITMDTLHAGKNLSGPSTLAHYEHTGRAVADVAAGEDAHGIWVAGALRSTVTDEQARALRGSPLSGDWRNIGGTLELVAALAVNVPGFPIPRPKGLVAGGKMQSLVASGVLIPQADEEEVVEEEVDVEQPTLFSTYLPYLKKVAEREMEKEVGELAARVTTADLAKRVGV